jgi:glycosyltransferase involved in cell wall biosynthesis
MKIAYVIPGSGGSFYCENCLRDIDLVNAIRGLGHDVIIVPMYLPFFAGDNDIDGSLPLFYGAINTYLMYKLPFLRKAPAWFTRIFDSPALLHAAAKKAGSTRAVTLGEMTISLLQGEEGEHAVELNRLVSTLHDDVQPDLVHLSNALLLGLAGQIKQKLRVPLTCSLQDEDTWVDAMHSHHAEQVWRMMSEKAEYVDAFFPVSRYYARKMQNLMHLPEERLHVAHVGVDTELFKPGEPSFNPPVIGFLSRMSESLGLGLLAEAFIHLKRDPSLSDARLHISGGQTSDDSKFIATMTKRFKAEGVLKDVEIVQDFDKESRIRFLSNLSVLSVPALTEHAFGSYVFEAMALGIPVAQPELGAFPELIGETGGGIVYSPNDVEMLTTSLKSILCNHEKATELGKQGSKTVHRKFGLKTTARKILDVYQSCLMKK